VSVHDGDAAAGFKEELVPLTVGMVLRWRPTVRFYAKRFQLLEELEAAGLVRAYRLGGDDFGVQFNEFGDELIVRPDSLSFRGLGIDEERTHAGLEAAALSLSHLSIDSAMHLWTHQFLLPVSLDYADARGQAASKLMPGLKERLPIADFAVLVDRSESIGAYTLQAEFGVVERREVPQRIVRLAGRMNIGAGDSPPPWDVELDDLPSVALFADISLNGKELVTDLSGTVLASEWRAANAESIAAAQILLDLSFEPQAHREDEA
jgi:hypothetical protein